MSFKTCIFCPNNEQKKGQMESILFGYILQSIFFSRKKKVKQVWNNIREGK